VRTRVIAACTVAFAMFSVLLCLVVPRSFRAFASESLRERTRSMATSAALHVRQTGAESLAYAARAIEGELDFESLAILDSEGRVLTVWPTGARGWHSPVERAEQLTESRDHFLATAPIGGRWNEWIAVRTSTARLRQDIASITALLFALLLSTGTALFALAGYLLRAVLEPLDEIRLAARHLADRELGARSAGDAEVDELGGLISRLSDDARRGGTVETQFERTPKREAHVSRVPGEERRQGDRRAPGAVPE
jgi:hypothetical protein